MYRFVLLILIFHSTAFGQAYKTYTTSNITIDVPPSWQIQKHSESNFEFIDIKNGKELTRLWVGVFPIKTSGGAMFDFDYYSPEKHANELISWLQRQYSAKASILKVYEKYTSSFDATVSLKNVGLETKANIRLVVLGDEVLTSVYVKNVDENFDNDQILYHILNSLKQSFYNRHGAHFKQPDFKMPIPITQKELLGSWFYGNAHRITFDSPGYHEDIVIETTKAIDNAGINYTFYKNGKYQLSYRSSSLSGAGKLEIYCIEIGNYNLSGEEVVFKPIKYIGKSNFNADKHNYNKTMNIPERKGIIQRIAPDKIQIKEPCAELMAETWCNSGQLYFVTYESIKKTKKEKL